MLKNGVTLVELLVVMALLAIFAIMIIGGINFIAQVDKGADADRKSDLNRIKISFEDYFNDVGCYPDQALVNNLNNSVNCGSSTVFDPWLEPWLCDGAGEAYTVVVEDSLCPVWFVIVTDLRNEHDDVLDGVCGVEGCPIYGANPPETANYGVSSDNISWWDNGVECSAGCFQLTDGTDCNSAGGGCVSNCYTGGPPGYPCHPACAVSSCGQ